MAAFSRPLARAVARVESHQGPGRTASQAAEQWMLDELHAADGHWREYLEDRWKREAALEAFHEYAYRWY